MFDLNQYVTDSERLSDQAFEWGKLQWLCNEQLSPGAAQTLGICHIFAGQRNPLHYHPNCEEVLYMLAGTGRHSFDGQTVELRPGCTIRVPAGVKHNFVNTGSETITCLISFSAGVRETVFLE